MAMAHLFKFTTKPNHPVCEAELIFYVENKENAETRLNNLLIDRYYFAYSYHPDALLVYLGEFQPSVDFKDGVITYQNGEY